MCVKVMRIFTIMTSTYVVSFYNVIGRFVNPLSIHNNNDKSIWLLNKYIVISTTL